MKTKERSIKRQSIAIRMTDELLARLDAHAEKLKKQFPGMDVSRGSVIRMFTERCLAAEEQRHEAN